VAGFSNANNNLTIGTWNKLVVAKDRRERMPWEIDGQRMIRLQDLSREAG
jgi:hypothetical protein